MSDWTEGIQNAIRYIEDNLAGELEAEEIAKRAYVSPFYFQRIFAALCGISLGEYIRNRRLTLAAQELTATEAKVIDIAANLNIEMYTPPAENPEDNYNEIWLPVERIG